MGTVANSSAAAARAKGLLMKVDDNPARARSVGLEPVGGVEDQHVDRGAAGDQPEAQLLFEGGKEGGSRRPVRRPAERKIVAPSKPRFVDNFAIDHEGQIVG